MALSSNSAFTGDVVFWMNNFKAPSVTRLLDRTKLGASASCRHKLDRGEESIRYVPKKIYQLVSYGHGHW